MLAQDYNMTLEEALEKTKHRPDFQKKLQHSIDLLRKAEKLALKYDAEDGFYLAFSAGKDSQAMFHVAQMGGVKFKAHMNFTSVDPPQVIIFKRKQYPCVVEHPPRASIFDLAVEKGILPTMRIRWCCAELKESAGAGKVTLIGIRKSESSRRAKRHEVEVSNKQFSGNLEQFAKWQQEQIAKKEEKLMRKMKREGKKVNEDEFSLQQDNEVRCINGKDSILVSPIFEWSESDVWYFLNDVLGVPHCELYDQGYTRIGCIMCPMSQCKHKLREMKDFPHVKRGWIRAIKQIRAGGGITNQTYWKPINYPPTHTQRRERRWGWKDKQLPEHPNIYATTGWISNPEVKAWYMEQDSQHGNVGGFSADPSADGAVEGVHEPTEDEIAEKIYSWWISGLSYSEWYAREYLQLKIPFTYDDENEGDLETDTQL